MTLPADDPHVNQEPKATDTPWTIKTWFQDSRVSVLDEQGNVILDLIPREVAERVVALSRLVVHCANCGADYAQTGIEAGCPCHLKSKLDALLEATGEATVQWNQELMRADRLAERLREAERLMRIPISDVCDDYRANGGFMHLCETCKHDHFRHLLKDCFRAFLAASMEAGK